MCLNFLIDLIPNNIGIIAAWKWANNRIEKNKTNYQTEIEIQKTCSVILVEIDTIARLLWSILWEQKGKQDILSEN